MSTYYFVLKLIIAVSAVGTAAIIISLASMVSTVFARLTSRAETVAETN